VHLGEQRIIHRRMHKPYKKRMRMPSMLDPHLADIERWVAAEPRLTALAHPPAAIVATLGSVLADLRLAT
jgi:hypothetical protein